MRLASQVKSYRQRAILAKTAQPASSASTINLPASNARQDLQRRQLALRRARFALPENDQTLIGQRAPSAISIRFPQEQRIHAHRAMQTKRHPKDRVDATRASPVLSLATMDTRAKLARQGGNDPIPK